MELTKRRAPQYHSAANLEQLEAGLRRGKATTLGSNGGAENARMEKAGLENAAPYSRVGKRKTGKGTELQGWKMRDWKTRDQNCRGGKRETGKRGNVFFMESQACLLVWFADA